MTQFYPLNKLLFWTLLSIMILLIFKPISVIFY